jgi:hypothetical protein
MDIVNGKEAVKKGISYNPKGFAYSLFLIPYQ